MAGEFSSAVLDNFNRADGTLGANWTNFHPGASLGFIANILGVKGNQGWNSSTAGPNKSGAVWNSGVIAGFAEAYLTASVLPGDWGGLLLRVQNPNGSTLKAYMILGLQPSHSYEISRLDSSGSQTILLTGSLTGWTNGDKLGARCYTNGSGNVVIELWIKQGAGAWTLNQTVTDSSASKITADGYAGVVWGNGGSADTAGRFDDFGAGTFGTSNVDAATETFALTPSGADVYTGATVDAGTLAFSLKPSASELFVTSTVDAATVRLTLGVSGIEDYRPAIYAFVAASVEKWDATVIESVRFRLRVKEDRWLARIFGEG